MRTVELRRHTMRIKPGQHLSQPGVSLARRVGDDIGPFARVITSPTPRAYETAIAMGFAVHEQVDMLSQIPDVVAGALPWDVGFSGWAEAYQAISVVKQFCDKQAQMYRLLAQTLQNGEAGLIVTHGGMIEAGAVSLLPETDFTTWGSAIDYCEGVRLQFDHTRCVGAEALRL